MNWVDNLGTTQLTDQVRSEKCDLTWSDSHSSWDLVFQSIYHEAYNHIVNADVLFVHVQNDHSVSTIISQHTWLGIITDYDEKDYYRAAVENVDFAAYKRSSLIKYNLVNMFETHLQNSITIYEKNNDIITIMQITEVYLKI